MHLCTRIKFTVIITKYHDGTNIVKSTESTIMTIVFFNEQSFFRLSSHPEKSSQYIDKPLLNNLVNTILYLLYRGSAKQAMSLAFSPN